MRVRCRSLQPAVELFVHRRNPCHPCPWWLLAWLLKMCGRPILNSQLATCFVVSGEEEYGTVGILMHRHHLKKQFQVPHKHLQELLDVYGMLKEHQPPNAIMCKEVKVRHSTYCSLVSRSHVPRPMSRPHLVALEAFYLSKAAPFPWRPSVFNHLLIPLNSEGEKRG